MEFNYNKFKPYTPSGRREKVEIMNLSGGRSSAYTMMSLLNGGFGKDGDMAIFENTGLEDESCYVFLNDLKEVTPFPIKWLEYQLTDKFVEELVWSSFSYDKFFNNQYSSIGEILNLKKLLSYDFVKSPNNFWYRDLFSDSKANFKEVDFESASRNGKPFADAFIYKSAIRIMKREGLIVPNVGQRWCTGDLKEKTCANYVKSLGIKDYNSYVGMRHDEPRRVNKVFLKNNFSENVYYDAPLHWIEIVKNDVVTAWEGQPFDLGRTPENFTNCFLDLLGNCGLCHLKNKTKKIYLIQNGLGFVNFYIQIERIVNNYNGGKKEAMSRIHGTYESLVELANNMPKVSIKEVLSEHETEFECLSCGD